MSGALPERLPDAPWRTREGLAQLCEALGAARGEARYVGGAVRDGLLGIPVQDIDIATLHLPEEVMRRVSGAGFKAVPTGLAHGTVTAVVHHWPVEITTLRRDVSTDGRRATVAFGTDWRADAARRDFTMNALYAAMDGSLYDPLAGIEDCLARKVRFIGKPAQRIEEDRLRVFRFFRFSASHGNERIDPDGYAACKAAAGTLDRLAAERVGAELRRMLGLPRVANTLGAMVRAGVLSLPPQSLKALHSYERQARRPDFTARLAILMAEMSSDALQLMWRLSNDEMRTAQAVLTVARLLGDFHVNEAAYRHPAALVDGVDVAGVLSNWSEAGKAAIREQLARLDVPRFPLNGGDLIASGWSPGPALGAELERLESVWIASGFALDREALIGQVRR